MLLVGKKVWLGRSVLAAYMLLVCFGHALHALPGHQHGGSSCGCHSDNVLDSGNSCSTNCHDTHGCEPSHSHLSLDCPFGHVVTTADAKSQDSCQHVRLIDAIALWQDAGCDESCVICELLAAPQSAHLSVDVDSAILPLYFAINAPYAFCVSDVLSNFSARGPPSVIA